eukprot:TRINITY_DN938_c0_g2_i1.p1 TRINITY_DN938_c0_g2~~TRINITY_DN938_c0_g2_i1.p1  ORF type:complete len:238 (+),score=37.47 TRINITY_DN938_c0_g2_i1:217-930(+)
MQYDCNWYARSAASRCKFFGRNVYGANEACCACGGGLREFETNVPATQAPPTPSPTPSPETPAPLTGASPADVAPIDAPFETQCEDRLPGGGMWHLGGRPDYGCNWYTTSSAFCRRYGHFYGHGSVYTANEACCVCGGGLRGIETNVPTTPAPPTLSPGTSAPLTDAPPTDAALIDAPFETQCEDRLLPGGVKWYDSFGSRYDCNWYASAGRCTSFGWSYRNVYTANEACCVCGGGA